MPTLTKQQIRDYQGYNELETYQANASFQSFKVTRFTSALQCAVSKWCWLLAMTCRAQGASNHAKAFDQLDVSLLRPCLSILLTALKEVSWPPGHSKRNQWMSVALWTHGPQEGGQKKVKALHVRSWFKPKSSTCLVGVSTALSLLGILYILFCT